MFFILHVYTDVCLLSANTYFLDKNSLLIFFYIIFNTQQSPLKLMESFIVLMCSSEKSTNASLLLAWQYLKEPFPVLGDLAVQ